MEVIVAMTATVIAFLTVWPWRNSAPDFGVTPASAFKRWPNRRKRIVVLGWHWALWAGCMGVMTGLNLSHCERPSRMVPVVESAYQNPNRVLPCGAP